jgi:hypothetical protein
MKKILFLSFVLLVACSFSLYAAETPVVPAETSAGAADESQQPAQDEAAVDSIQQPAQDESLGEDTEQIDAVESAEIESEYTFGTVTKISPEELVIREFDDATGDEIEVAYKLNEKTQLENVKDTTEVAAGDYAEIDFVLENGQRVALAVNIEKAEEMEPEA